MKPFSLMCMMTLVALALMPLTITAHAQAFSFTGGSTATGGNVTAGETFTVGAIPISVTDLGVWDFQLDGLADAHPVTIWNGSGTLLATATVPSGTTGTLVGQYRYSSLLSPVTLAANTSYTIGAYYSANHDSTAAFIPLANITSASGVTYGAATLSVGPAFPPPSTSFIGDNVAANFRFTSGSAVTPEPGSVALVGAMILAGAGFVRRRRNIR